MAPPIDPATLRDALVNAMHVNSVNYDDHTGPPNIYAGGSAFVAVVHAPADALAMNGQLAALGWRLTSTLRNEAEAFSAGVWTRT